MYGVAEYCAQGVHGNAGLVTMQKCHAVAMLKSAGVSNTFGVRLQLRGFDLIR